MVIRYDKCSMNGCSIMRIAIDRLERMCYNTGMENKDKTTKTYVLLSVDDNGHETRQYENGDIRDERGRLLSMGTGIENHLITSDTAHDYHRMRKEKNLRAIESKLVDITKTRLPAEAIAAIVGKRAELAMNDDTKVGNDAARIVLQAVDAYQNRVNEDNRIDVLRHEYTMDERTMELLERIAAVRRGDVIDGTVMRNNDEE